MSNKATQDRVARGVQWLNENLGPDWPEFIDRNELDMASPNRCILGQQSIDGQRCGGYFAIVTAPIQRGGLDMGFRWAENHGFLDCHASRFSELQAEWDEYLDGYELLQEERESVA